MTSVKTRPIQFICDGRNIAFTIDGEATWMLKDAHINLTHVEQIIGLQPEIVTREGRRVFPHRSGHHELELTVHVIGTNPPEVSDSGIELGIDVFDNLTVNELFKLINKKIQRRNKK